MRSIHFQCACRFKLDAVVTGSAAAGNERIQFFRLGDRSTPLVRCPVCNRDYSAVSLDDFYRDIWKD